MRLLPPLVVMAFLATGFECAVAAPQQHAKHAASGWQPGGPLRPLYQSAVKAIHAREFDTAEVLCQKGLKLAPSDKAFTDLTAQIRQWRRDTLQTQVTTQYALALRLVHEGRYDAAESACKRGLELEPGNNSFIELQRDIASRRNANLQNYMLEVYQTAATLMNEGKYRAAIAKCREGLRRQPHDVELEALLKRIRARERGDQ